jgi:hypothetical protein
VHHTDAGNIGLEDWYLPPRTNWSREFLLFPEKRSKKCCSTSRKAMCYPNSVKPTKEGRPRKTIYSDIVTCLQELIGLENFFFFQKKKQKALFRFAEAIS